MKVELISYSNLGEKVCGIASKTCVSENIPGVDDDVSSEKTPKTAHNFIDLTGQRFGRLVAMYRVPGFTKDTRWHCRCDCGNEVSIRRLTLRNGTATSCECYHNEIAGENFKTHGLSGTRLHHIWEGMKHRCYLKNDVGFHKYGGRGIKICDEWKSDFKAFYEWSMLNGYEENLTIDRIDCDGDYSPENCRWVDIVTQANNTRANRRIECRGEIHTLAEWPRISGIKSATIKERLNRGWAADRAIFEEPKINRYK